MLAFPLGLVLGCRFGVGPGLGVGLGLGVLLLVLLCHEEEGGGHLSAGEGGDVGVDVLPVTLASNLDLGLSCFTWVWWQVSLQNPL